LSLWDKQQKQQLPPDEDIKKLERRVEAEHKNLPRQVKAMEGDK
jgi:hypothetical protein